MSASLVATGLGAGHGDRTLFSGLDVVVAPGDVVGLVGVNGAGKSTLLRILAGLRAAEQGSVKLSPSDAVVGYLPQEQTAREGESVLDFVARRTGVTGAQLAMDEAAGQLTDGGVGAHDAYSSALERWLGLGGADLEERVAALAADVGLGVDLGALMATLSGGQKARAGLTSLLLSRFDLVLLDEPTNDLDMPGLERLEAFVADLRIGAVIVSHDREFLARTVTSVLELDLAQQKIRQVSGGYLAYLEEREVEGRHEREAYDAYADRRDALGQRAHRQRAWMEKGVANARRKATDNDKIGRKFRAESTEKQAAKARQTQRMIERLDEVVEPRKVWQLRMEIAVAPRSGAVAAVANHAVVRRGGFRLGPVDLQIDWADRVAITGPNGSGKTTLLGLLLGRIAPEQGSAALGPGVLVGEVDQARALLDDAAPLARAIGAQLPELDDAAVRTLLAKFGLGADQSRRPTSSLSPGERTRAALALLQGGPSRPVRSTPASHPTPPPTPARCRSTRPRRTSSTTPSTRQNLFALKEFGNIYTRIMNPTQDAVEERLASLEGGVGALLVASGQAAETAAILNVAEAGDHIVSSPRLYGGTYNLFHYTFAQARHRGHLRRGPGRPREWRAAVRPNTKAFFAETISNPKIDILDIEAVAGVAHESRRPAHRRQHGRDAVPDPPARVRRRHRRALGDQVPRRSRHGDRRRDRRRRQVRLRRRTRRGSRASTSPTRATTGWSTPATSGSAARSAPTWPSSSRRGFSCCATSVPAISPFNAFLIAQGIETLSLRIERHVAERPGGRRVARGARRGRVGELRRPAVEPVVRAGQEVRPQGRRRGAGVRDQGRRRGRPAASSRRSSCTATSPTSVTCAAWSSTRRRRRTRSSRRRSSSRPA